MPENGKWVADPYRDTIPTGTTRPIIDTSANNENMSSQAPSEIERPNKDKVYPVYGTGGK